MNVPPPYAVSSRLVSGKLEEHHALLFTCANGLSPVVPGPGGAATSSSSWLAHVSAVALDDDQRAAVVSDSWLAGDAFLSSFVPRYSSTAGQNLPTARQLPLALVFYASQSCGWRGQA